MSTMPENPNITLAQLARGRALACITTHDEAVDLLTLTGARRAARIMQKASVGAITTSDIDMFAMVGGWTQSMATASVFFYLYNSNLVRKLPPYKRIAISTTLPTAASLAEGHSAPIGRVVVGHTILQPVLISEILVVSKETLLDDGAESLFVAELRTAIGKKVDAGFLGALFAGTSANTVPATTDAVGDLRNAVLSLAPRGDTSRLVALAAPDVAVKTAFLGADGGGTFPGMTPSGGQLRGLTCVVSSGIPSGQLAVLDAAQIGAAVVAFDVQVSQNASLEMSDAPSSSSAVPTSTSQVSMYQTDAFAVRASATIAAQQLRDDVAVLIENINWGGP